MSNDYRDDDVLDRPSEPVSSATLVRTRLPSQNLRLGNPQPMEPLSAAMSHAVSALLQAIQTGNVNFIRETFKVQRRALVETYKAADVDVKGQGILLESLIQANGYSMTDIFPPEESAKIGQSLRRPTTQILGPVDTMPSPIED